MRFIALTFTLLLALPVYADGFLTRLLNKPVPGGVAVVHLGEGTVQPHATYNGNPVLVVHEDQKRWIAIVGIPLSAQPGAQSISLSDGRTLSFNIGAKNYETEHITLENQEMVTPSPENLERIKREIDIQKTAYKIFSPRHPTNLLLDKPVNGPFSSGFGTKRFFNEQPRNPHAGLDFAVPVGTSVKAPAAGRIILAGDYFYNGQTVFVDHGRGLISMFCHLSSIDVKVGDEVARGAHVAKSGATGRVTGPHLHWNVSLNGVRVDPAIFIGAFKP